MPLLRGIVLWKFPTKKVDVDRLNHWNVDWMKRTHDHEMFLQCFEKNCLHSDSEVERVFADFDIMLRLVGLINVIHIISCLVNLQKRTLLMSLSATTKINIGLHSDINKVMFDMVIETFELTF